MHTSTFPRLIRLTLAVVLVAACSRGTPAASLEAKLPVLPGEAWDQACGALERLDPNARQVEGVGGRTAVAKAPLDIAGYHFEQLSIAGVAARPNVRTVTLSAPAPGAGCDRAREDLLKALGSEWTAGDLRLGAITATKGSTRAARIVCTGAELSVSIIG